MADPTTLTVVSSTATDLDDDLVKDMTGVLLVLRPPLWPRGARNRAEKALCVSRTLWDPWRCHSPRRQSDHAGPSGIPLRARPVFDDAFGRDPSNQVTPRSPVAPGFVRGHL